MAEKLIRDGLVAVIYHPEFGSGFYDPKGRGRTDRELVEAVLAAGGVEPPTGRDWDARYNEFQPHDYRIAWVKEGALYRIEEYDGQETVVLASEQHWEVA